MRKILFSILLVLHLITVSAASKQPVKLKLPWDKERVALAQKGDADSQAYVGWCYYLGEDGVKENNFEAVKWLKLATNGGSPFGKYYLGLAYLNGFGVAKNTALGRTYCDTSSAVIEKLAEEGNVEACFYMGEAYLYEAQDYKTALKYYLYGAEHGDIRCQIGAANVYMETHGNLSEKVVQWHKAAYENGSPIGQYHMGNYYSDGLFGARSSEKAFELYQQAANAGYYLAMTKVGQAYEHGRGTKQDIQTAIKWYKKAIDFDECEAEYNLACLYRDGYGVNRNYYTALKYMKMSAKHGIEIAINDLAEMQRLGPAHYQKLPLRTENLIEEEDVLSEDDAFNNLVLSDNWHEVPDDMKKEYLLAFKKEKIKEWGRDRATKVAQHLVEIGFTEEQLKYSQGISPNLYSVSTVHFPDATCRIIKYSHCTYYLIDDSLIAMQWCNGLTIGDTTVIKKANGDIVVNKDK